MGFLRFFHLKQFYKKKGYLCIDHPHPTHTNTIFIIYGTLWNVFLFNYGFSVLTHYLSEIVMVSHILYITACVYLSRHYWHST